MAAIFCSFEIAFALNESSVLAGRDLRGWTYRHGAFFDVWFEAARVGEPVPPWFWSSWLTHAFLHGGDGAVFFTFVCHQKKKK